MRILDHAGPAVTFHPAQVSVRHNTHSCAADCLIHDASSWYNAVGEWHGGACRPGPFASDPTDPTRRIHHTGDIARCTEDGVYIILGRQDRMLKLNGQRIEPGEIEAALRACDGVADAAVVSPNGRTLLAFVALHSGTTPDAVRASLRTRLPASMIPSRIMPLDVLPQLPGGKVDLVRLTTLAKRGIAA